MDLSLNLQLERVPGEFLIPDPPVRLTPAEEEWFTWATDSLEDCLYDTTWVEENEEMTTRQGQLDFIQMRLEVDAEGLCTSAHRHGEGGVPGHRRALRSLRPSFPSR